MGHDETGMPQEISSILAHNEGSRKTDYMRRLIFYVQFFTAVLQMVIKELFWLKADFLE